MPRGATALLSTITVLLVLAGCAPDGSNGPSNISATDETAESPTRGAESPTRGAEPSTTKPPTAGIRALPKDTARRSGEGSRASNLVLVDVRVAAAEGFDRIVLEFSGTGTPGWVVNYVGEAVLDGSGEGVDLGGRAALDIYASDTTWPAADYYDGPTRLVSKSSGNVTDVYVGGTFEGTTQVLAGIDGAPAPFRVFTLTAPSRLVVDVMDTVQEDAD